MGIGWQELLIVLMIVVIIFGSGKLPEIGGTLGRGIKEFKAQAEDDQFDTRGVAGAGLKDEGAVLASRELRADQI